MRCTHYALTLAACLALACGSSQGTPAAGGGGIAGSAGDASAGMAGGAGVPGGAGVAGGVGAAGGDARPSFTQAELASLHALSPDSLPTAPADISNRFSDQPAAALLGQKLFFEKGFSGKLIDGDDDGSASTLGNKGDTGKVACAGCHVPSAGFLDNRTLGQQVSLAAGWGRRKAPSLLDVGQASLLTWDGRHDALYNQPFGPIESPVEMNSSRLYVAQQIFLHHRVDYEAIFGVMPPLDDATRFPVVTAENTGCQPTTVDTLVACNGTQHGVPGDKAEFDGLAPADRDLVTEVVVNMGKALGAYERLLTCGTGRFDQWLHGKADALTSSEQRGAQLFIGRGQCASCHSGPYLSDQKFHNVGLQPTTVAVVFIDSNDLGAAAGLTAAIADPLNTRGHFSDGDDARLPSTVDPSMAGAFRTPVLRCQARRPSFMHTGQLASLKAVVSFFARGGDAFGYPGKSEISALNLTDQDQNDLVAFLQTLEGPGPAANLLVSP